MLGRRRTMADRRRCVVTGAGAVTPLGLDLKSTWDGVVNCRSGVSLISVFNPETFPVRIAGEVKGFDESIYISRDNEYLDIMSRATKYAIAAATMAVGSAKIDIKEIDPAGLGVSIGTGEAYAGLDEFDRIFGAENVYGSFITNKYRAESYAGGGRLWPIHHSANMAASLVATTFNAQGPNSTSATACASSGHAIGKAMRFIESGEADVVLAGGCEGIINEFSVAGFNALSTLSLRNDEPEKASRPFDLKRDGFILAEGAGMMVLEELGHAKARGAEILAELSGYGCSSNAYRITDSPPDGRGAALSMTLALEDGGKGIDDVDYINAHGTSTMLNDRCETRSIKSVFGDLAYKVPVSSNKSMFGHMISASGAVEAIVSVLAINNNLVPATINQEYSDPDCDLDYVPNTPRETRVDVVLSNSFAFGGQNVSLLIERFRDR